MSRGNVFELPTLFLLFKGNLLTVLLPYKLSSPFVGWLVGGSVGLLVATNKKEEEPSALARWGGSEQLLRFTTGWWNPHIG